MATLELVEAIVVLHVRYLKQDAPVDEDWQAMLESGPRPIEGGLDIVRGEKLLQVISQIVIEPTK